MDGRLNAGGTGLYGLTDLKFLNNDCLNAGSNLTAIGVPYTPSQMQFAGNRYYDPGLGQSSWAQLLNTNIGIGAWLAGYDTTGQILTALPYGDPSRTIATYDAAVGAAGTVADFLAQALLISPTNYRTQYMAPAAAGYVRAGFTADTTAPTATAAAATVNAGSLAGTAYAFKVTYADNALLNAATVGANDVLVNRSQRVRAGGHVRLGHDRHGHRGRAAGRRHLPNHPAGRRVGRRAGRDVRPQPAPRGRGRHDRQPVRRRHAGHVRRRPDPPDGTRPPPPTSPRSAGPATRSPSRTPTPAAST